jgi:hypothetical protein
MNERILELAEQAGYSWHNQFSGPILSPNAIEKFAELIVRECASKAWFVEQYGIGDGTPVSKQIKEHFGVEE